ncbi:MurR/RpiR family transcriptional regulator [Fusobacteria bacterium ZRK30]|nr:MurR/RpiR family transcriptional regulator [Fusobacteria bacterium ZRK30]
MSITLRIKNEIKNLSKTEIKVANYILDNLEEVKTITSSDLAKKIGVGQSTIIKFIKKIDIKGFTEFKISLGEELAKASSTTSYLYGDITLNDSMEDISKKLSYNSINAISETLDNLNFHQLDIAIDYLHKARKIVILGVGASSLVAKDFFYKLSKIGKMAFHDFDPHVQLTHTTTLNKEDLVVAISHGGESKEVILGVEKAKEHGATTISITNIGNNPVSNNSDINLYSIAYEDLFRSSAISSRMAQLSLIDILFIGIVQREYQNSTTSIKESRDLIKKLKTV